MKKDERNYTNVLHASNYNRITLLFKIYIYIIHIIVQKKRQLWNTSEVAVLESPLRERETAIKL